MIKYTKKEMFDKIFNENQNKVDFIDFIFEANRDIENNLDVLDRKNQTKKYKFFKKLNLYIENKAVVI